LTVIGLRSIDKFYGGRAVLRGLDLSVAPGARIGLVGGNGAGKSTLLRLLAGLEEPDGGEVVRRRGLRVASFPSTSSVGPTPRWRSARRAARARPGAAELEACEERLGEPEVTGDLRRMERVLERHASLIERFTELGGNGFDGEARGRLAELGFDRDDIDRPMDELSGGQRKLAV
jgi:ATPase subunit of ABC transporter with duplicated ATPase domains